MVEQQMSGGRGSDDFGAWDYYNQKNDQKMLRRSESGGRSFGLECREDRVMHGGYGGRHNFGGQFSGGDSSFGSQHFGEGLGRFWTGGPGHMAKDRGDGGRHNFGGPFYGGDSNSESQNFGVPARFWTGGPGHVAEDRGYGGRHYFGGQYNGGHSNFESQNFGGPARFRTGGPAHMTEDRVSMFSSRTSFGDSSAGGFNNRSSNSGGASFDADSTAGHNFRGYREKNYGSGNFLNPPMFSGFQNSTPGNDGRGDGQPRGFGNGQY